jgi:phosphate/phosphite/phosphonate ABC transporter binding protein
MRLLHPAVGAGCFMLLLGTAAGAGDPSWPQELTFALLSTESSPEIVRRWTPILSQLEKDLGITVKHVQATDYRGTIEALKFKKAEVGWLGPKAYVEATNHNYANVDAVAQVQQANGSLGYRSCLIVHQDSDAFGPEDLAGKTFAFNDPNSTSGYLVPSAFFLMEMGIDPKNYFSRLTFSGSHEASIIAVANKKVDAASTNAERHGATALRHAGRRFRRARPRARRPDPPHDRRHRPAPAVRRHARQQRDEPPQRSVPADRADAAVRRLHGRHDPSLLPDVAAVRLQHRQRQLGQSERLPQ